MRAISLWQPWATLIVTGQKQFETRGWKTNYHGPLLIHAAKKKDKEIESACYDEDIRAALETFGYGFNSLPYGSIIGQVTMIDCRETSILAPSISRKEDAFGDWYPGRFAWRLAHAKRYLAPIPYKGSQGFFDVPDSVLSSVGAHQ